VLSRHRGKSGHGKRGVMTTLFLERVEEDPRFQVQCWHILSIGRGIFGRRRSRSPVVCAMRRYDSPPDALAVWEVWPQER
jgi:hypothetical protein